MSTKVLNDTSNLNHHNHNHQNHIIDPTMTSGKFIENIGKKNSI